MRLERLRHRSGQLLRARDLRDQLAYQERLRALHERIPHPAAVDNPHVASGSTPGDGTPWRPWAGPRAAYGVEVAIDAGAHGFTDTPCYFGWLATGGRSRVPVLVPYVEDVSAAGFVFRLAMRGLGGDTGPVELVGIALAERWSVCWIAVSRPVDLLEGE
ncbi:hypothetical protein [Nonomuraea jiangxiensis]|uniref:Uncharacterized protein n=1 Tax=Nonomuraea jiangxiensis TaxID=633440 RepID=A0A1G9EXZ4_9ACTN|nr:hypothetical protein [Nonomuraea jiangxiensis]SDK80960.1 hypothetical protein SAMN05421869_11953 [Nonomuraea jiangxiensis]